MAKQSISGTALAVAAGGAFLVYIGIKGSDPVEELRSILRGEAPPSLSRQSKFKGFGETILNIGSVASANAALLESGKKYLGVRYSWMGTTRNGMDCSGLCWRAAKDIGFPGLRFTTATVALSKYVSKVPSPAPGDMIVWPGDHMGIDAGGGKMLNAPHTGTVVRFDSWTPVRNGNSALYLRLKLPTAIGDSVPGGRGGV